MYPGMMHVLLAAPWARRNFGERALLSREERAASTVAGGRVECFVLNSWESTCVVRPGARAFGELLGDVQDIVVPTRTAFLPGMWSPGCVEEKRHIRIHVLSRRILVGFHVRVHFPEQRIAYVE